MNIKHYFDKAMGGLVLNQYTMYISLAAAILLFIGGVILYVRREKSKTLGGKRWPGISCMGIAAISLLTTILQYSIFL